MVTLMAFLAEVPDSIPGIGDAASKILHFFINHCVSMHCVIILRSFGLCVFEFCLPSWFYQTLETLVCLTGIPKADVLL